MLKTSAFPKFATKVNLPSSTVNRFSQDGRPVHTYPDIFEPPTFFFPDIASIHTHTANSVANPDFFKSAIKSEKKINPQQIQYRMDGE